jgi:hypothetical protein
MNSADLPLVCTFRGLSAPSEFNCDAVFRQVHEPKSASLHVD